MGMNRLSGMARCDDNRGTEQFIQRTRSDELFLFNALTRVFTSPSPIITSTCSFPCNPTIETEEADAKRTHHQQTLHHSHRILEDEADALQSSHASYSREAFSALCLRQRILWVKRPLQSHWRESGVSRRPEFPPSFSAETPPIPRCEHTLRERFPRALHRKVSMSGSTLSSRSFMDSMEVSIPAVSRCSWARSWTLESSGVFLACGLVCGSLWLLL